MKPTKDEIERGADRIAGWGPQWRKDILEMEPNEREWIVMLAALLDARPEESEGADSK